MSHAFNNYVPAYPKPKDTPKLNQSHIKVMPDGREILTLALTEDAIGAAGRAEYKSRIRQMWERQGGICCLYGFLSECPGKMLMRESTFEHEHGRGAGKRDDRIWLPNGRRINGAAHYVCNGIKSSRFIPYNGYPKST